MVGEPLAGRTILVHGEQGVGDAGDHRAALDVGEQFVDRAHAPRLAGGEDEGADARAALRAGGGARGGRLARQRTRRPERRDAAAGGISTTTVPPSRAWASACCTQASSDSVRGGKPYSQRES